MIQFRCKILNRYCIAGQSNTVVSELLKQLKRLQSENDRQYRPVSDLTLDKLVVSVTARDLANDCASIRNLAFIGRALD